MSKRVLFVCLGNICRSPAAEAIAHFWSQKLRLDVDVQSAGTIGIHAGNSPDRRMRAAGEARGYQLRSKARQVTRHDLQPGHFDLVVAMDRNNLADLRSLAGMNPPHVKLFGDFLDAHNGGAPDSGIDIPDPYYGGADGFEQVLDMLEQGCPRILQLLVSGERVWNANSSDFVDGNGGD